MDEEALRLLERLEERLYAAWILYAIISFTYWIPVAQGFLVLISTTWYRGLPEKAQNIISVVYWLGLGVASFYVAAVPHWRRYIKRLAAKTRKPRYTVLATASWPLGALAGYLAVWATGTERTAPVWLLTFVGVGTLGQAIVERVVFRRIPASFPAVLASFAGLAALPWVPLDPYVETVYTLAVLSLGYSLTVLCYAARSLAAATT